MSAQDKAENTAQKAAGKVKENIGKITGDETAEPEGRADQGDLENSGEKVKDAFKK
jgi:uncharacterized protein YjbJ (UPF0337 family)